MNRVSGSDRIPTELFQILKDDAVKALHSICQYIWKTQQWSQDWKGQFSFQSQRKAMRTNVQTTVQVCSFHMLAKVMLKILQLRLQQYINQELPDVQAGFIKGRGTREQIASIYWIIKKKQRNSKKKKIYFCFTDYSKASDCVCGSQQMMENSERDGNTRLPCLCAEIPVCRSRSNS